MSMLLVLAGVLVVLMLIGALLTPWWALELSAGVAAAAGGLLSGIWGLFAGLAGGMFGLLTGLVSTAGAVLVALGAVLVAVPLALLAALAAVFLGLLPLLLPVALLVGFVWLLVRLANRATPAVATVPALPPPG